MSTKTRKSAMSTPQQSAGTSSSQASGSKKNTPLSPARVSRMEEKIQLQNLNDRLAAYIDKVRFLEAENNLLGGQVTTIQEKYEREIKTTKEQYFTEISGLRTALDATSKEKAQALIELNNVKSSFNDLQKKLQKKERELASTEKTLSGLEVHNQDLQNKINHLQSEYKKLEDNYRECEQDRKSLAAVLADLRDQYDASMLRVTDLENKMQSLKEEMSFKETVYAKELSDSRMLKTVEISGIDASIREDYDQKLTDNLKELREQYESQMFANKEELEAMFQKQMSDLIRNYESKIKSSQGKEEETRNIKTRVEYLSSKVSELETQNEGLKNRIKDLELMIEQEREWNAIKLNEKDEENRKLREEAQIQLGEYQDLLGIKVALDMEIAAYRKLLEGEEARLNISHEEGASSESRSTPIRRTPLRTAKRKRAHFEIEESKSTGDVKVSASAKSDIEIADHDVEGKYIKLHNKGNTEVPLGGWHLIRKAGDQEVTHKFNRSSLIKPGSYLTVWSSDAKATHAPPTDYVMKGQRWLVADTMSSVLQNSNGEEMAARETSKKVFRTLEERVFESGYSPEEIYHQQGDFNKERCSVM